MGGGGGGVMPLLEARKWLFWMSYPHAHPISVEADHMKCLKKCEETINYFENIKLVSSFKLS